MVNPLYTEASAFQLESDITMRVFVVLLADFGRFQPKQPIRGHSATLTPAGRPSGLAGEQYVQSFQIESQTYQTPLSSRCRQTTQGKLTKAHDFFDDTNDGFHRTFAQTINHLANLGLQLVSHLDRRAGVRRRWCRRFGKSLSPTFVMWFTPSCDVWSNATLFYLGDVLLAEIAVIQRCALGLSYLGRNRIQGRDCFVLIVSVIGGGISHNTV